jgi:hypothetical protein
MKMKQKIFLLLMGVNKEMYVVEDTCMWLCSVRLWLITVKLEFCSEVIGWKWSKDVTYYRFKMNQELTFYWQLQRS